MDCRFWIGIWRYLVSKSKIDNRLAPSGFSIQNPKSKIQNRLSSYGAFQSDHTTSGTVRSERAGSMWEILDWRFGAAHSRLVAPQIFAIRNARNGVVRSGGPASSLRLRFAEVGRFRTPHLERRTRTRRPAKALDQGQEGLREQPVFQPQTGNPLKVGRVVGHKREIVNQSNRADHQVQWANGNSLA